MPNSNCFLRSAPKLWSLYRTWLSGAKAPWSGVTRSYGLPCRPSCADHLEDPRIQSDMHRKAVQIVHELGPAAIRPLSSALFNALEDPDWQNNTYALRSLYWSIPESPRSIAMLMRWLSNPLHGHLFGSIDCEELYPKLPQTMPLLVSCLRNPYLAREAAIGLGMMGSNALSAVPALAEVFHRGVS